MKKIASKVRGQYTTALRRENMLHDALEKQKQEANKLNESAIHYTPAQTRRRHQPPALRRPAAKNERSRRFGGIEVAIISGSSTARVRRLAPIEPNIPRNLMFAVVLGLASGVGLAFLLEGLDNTVRTTEQAQVISGLASLGMIPLGSKSAREGPNPKRLVIAILQRSGRTGHAGPAAIADGGVLSRSAHFPAPVESWRAAQGHHGHERSAPGRQDHHQHQYRRGPGAKRRARVADRRRSAPSEHSQNSRHGTAQRLEQCSHRQHQRWNTPSRAPAILPNLFVLPAGTPPPNPAELLASANMRDVLARVERAV